MSKKFDLVPYLTEIRESLDFTYGQYSLDEARRELISKEKRLKKLKPEQEMHTPEILLKINSLKKDIDGLNEYIPRAEKAFEERYDYNKFISNYLFCIIKNIPVAIFYGKEEKIKFHQERLEHLYSHSKIYEYDEDQYEDEYDPIEIFREKVTFHLNKLEELS